MVKAYCVKCKKKGQEMQDPEIMKTARGGFIAKGKCPDCGVKMAAMVSKDNAEKAVKEGAKKGY